MDERAAQTCLISVAMKKKRSTNRRKCIPGIKQNGLTVQRMNGCTARSMRYVCNGQQTWWKVRAGWAGADWVKVGSS